MGYSNWSSTRSFSSKTTYTPDTEEVILSASDLSASALFGYSVSIASDGSRVIVGAYYADPGGVTDAGAAYVYVRSGSTWTQEAILSASDKSVGAYFGWSVSLAGDGSRVIVGAYQADPGGVSNAGAVYVYVRSGSTWTQEAILSASDKSGNANFGCSVSIAGDGSRVIVGAYAADPGGVSNAGAAYIFS